MALSLDSRARVYITATITVTADPASATAVMLIDADTATPTQVPMTWVGAAVERTRTDRSGTTREWVRIARSASPIVGPAAADTAGATAITPGVQHVVQVLVTMPDTQVLPTREDRLIVELAPVA